MGKKIVIGSNNTRICMASFAYMDLLLLVPQILYCLISTTIYYYILVSLLSNVLNLISILVYIAKKFIRVGFLYG